MKKNLLFIMLIILIILTGCTTKTIYNIELEDYTLKYINSLKQIACDNDGAYYLERDTRANWIIRYIDYENQKDMPLCSRLECEHKDSSCTAFIEYTGNMYDIRVVGEKLMLLSTSAEEDWINVKNDDALSKIEIMDKNGENKKTLVKFQPNQSLIGTMAYDEKNIYTMLTETNKAKDNRISIKTILISVDRENGQIQKLYDYDNKTPYMLGIYNNKILTYFDNINNLKGSYITEIDAVDVYKKEIDNIMTLNSQERLMVHNNRLFIINNKSGIYEVSPSSDEKKIIFDSSECDMFVVSDMIDHFAVCYEYFSIIDKSNIILVDLNTGEKRDFSLVYDLENNERGKEAPAIDLLFEKNDDILIRNSYQEDTMTVPLYNGEKGNVWPIKKYGYAFIEKEDLLKNEYKFEKVVRNN